MLRAGCVSLALLGTSRAMAAGDYARLRYELDDPGGKCANEAAFRARVISRLGYDPFREDAPLDLHVRVVARGATVRAEITSAQPGKAPGKRTLEDPRCDALGETLASAVALVLDPVAAAAVPSSSAPAEDAPAAEPLPPPADRPADRPSLPPPAPSPEVSPSLVPVIYADFTTGFARTPTTLVGGRLGAGVRRGSFSIAAEGHAETSPDSAFIASNDRVEASAFSGAVVPCGHINLFQICGVGTVGSRSVKALDVVSPRSQGALFLVVGARGGLEVPLSGAIALRAHGELGVPLLRTTYTIDGVARSTTGLVEASFGAGILGRFR